LSGEVKAANEEEVKIVTRLHTATHLLHESLRRVLGDGVKQQGSDITADRLRFDFSYPQKLTPEQIFAVESKMNEEIAKDDVVAVREMPFTEALNSGALAFFKNKYPDTVKVYAVGDFSKEVCGGPHVTHTGEVGKVKIVKEEAVSAGVRRIRAILIK
jgi:alanyl-tRNA synthetase